MLQLVPLPEVQRLSPACIRILGGNPGKFTLQGTNTYLLGTGRERLLVDTAEGRPAWSAALARTLAAENATVAATLLTHWHPDHVGGVDHVRQLVPGVPVYQNTDGPGLAQRFADHAPITDGQEFRVDGATLRAVHTPGHTTNHMAFVLAEEDALLAGDNVLGQGTAVFEDLGVYLQSLARMRQVFAGPLYPGHGPVVADGPAKIDEYLQHRQQREDQVVRLLRLEPRQSLQGLQPVLSARTSSALVEAIYVDTPRDLHPAAERGIVKILEKLEAEGKAVRDGQQWALRERSPL